MRLVFLCMRKYHIAGYFVGGNFHEKLEEAPRIKFRGFNFRGAIFDNMTVM